MTDAEDIRSYCNPHPRLGEAAQRERLTGEVYVEDRKGRAIEALIASVRPGSVVEVIEMGLLAPIRATPAVRRAAVAKRVKQIADKGGLIRELATGHECRDQLPAMMMRAADFIRTAGRPTKKHTRRGKPRIEFTSEEMETISAIWFDRRHKNDAQRMAEINARLGRKPPLKRGVIWNRLGSPDPQPQE